jgi:hypothetical protein
MFMNRHLMNRILVFTVLSALSANTGLSQSAQGYFEGGTWKTIPPDLSISRCSESRAIAGTRAAALRLPKTVGSHYPVLYSQSNAESFATGYWVYAYPSSFGALDFSNNGRKAFVLTHPSVDSGKVTTYYISPQSYQSVWTIEDTGYGTANVKTQVINAQVTGTQEPEYIVWRSSSDDLPAGATLFRVYSKLSNTPLFKDCAVADTNTDYVFPVNFLESSASNFDLNGNGLLEFIKVQAPKSGGFGTRICVSVFDNLTLLDTIIATPFLSYHVSTTNDINSDGKPELVVVSDMAPTFYQWTSSGGGFQAIATLGTMEAIWRNPENVDSDADAEFVLQNDTDSLIVYSKTFSPKFRIGVPSGYTIVQYFIANVNASSNKEIVLVAAKDFKYSTSVYDLSVSTTPVWLDTAFQAEAVADIRKIGRSEILGITSAGSARLVNGANNFQPVWTCAGGTYTLAGPFVPSPYDVTDPIFQFLTAMLGYPFPGTSAIDFNGDGTCDLVFKCVTPSYATALVVVDANGIVRDTIPIDATGNNYVQAFDFNDNGRPELIITNSLSKEVSVVEHDGTVSVEQCNQVYGYSLAQNYPNPFNPKTMISYQLSADSRVRLEVFDILGRDVATLVDEERPAGAYTVVFDASKMSSGVYFCRMSAHPAGGRGDAVFTATQKLLLLK